MKEFHETKGGKQRNGQPHANQHTQGRNDDRGRKDVEAADEQKDVEAADEQKGGKQNNGNKHANQYTQGRNDDRGRKE